MYKFFDYQYDIEGLARLFSESRKIKIKSLFQVKDDITFEPSVVRLFELFPKIPRNRFNFELGANKQYVRPYISPGNNGLVIFPIDGHLTINFYSFSATRETLSPYKKLTDAEYKIIEDTLIDTVVIDRPMAFNGLIPHSYGSADRAVIIAILKIPLEVSWQDFIGQ
jgi:hypothetical protein